MDQQSIEEVLRIVSDTNSDFKVIHGWVSSPCPFAPWDHESGQDRNPSFGIKIEENGPSYVNCFTCKAYGTVSEMLERLQEVSGEDYADLIEETYDNEVLGSFVPSWENRKKGKNAARVLPPPPDVIFEDIYDEAPANHPYLKRRGIGKHTVRALDLRIDPDDRRRERILFPVHSIEGVFYGYTGRATDDRLVNKENPKVRDYFGLPKMHMLLGAHRILPEDAMVSVVEGLFDYAIMTEYDYPAVATLHAGATKEQIALLKKINKPIILFQDNDKAGREGNCSIAEALYTHVPVYGVIYPDSKKRNDPGRLTRLHVDNMIDDLEYLPDLKAIADFYEYHFDGYRIRK